MQRGQEQKEMPTIDLSQFSAGQIVTAFFIVIAVFAAFGPAIPKIVSTMRSVWQSIISFVKSREKKERQFEQIRTNADNIAQMSGKIDTLTHTLNQFIEDNKAKNDEIIHSVEELKKERLQDRLDRDRSEILDFANTCKNKRKHTANEFLHIIDIATKYHAAIEQQGVSNGAFEAEFDYIKRLYAKCVDENEFLSMEDETE